MNELMRVLSDGTFRKRLKVWCTTERGLNRGNGKHRMHSSDVVIVDGIIVKNRDGHPGKYVGGAIFIWEEEVSEFMVATAMNEWPPCG
jgi:hypothetical protein